MTVERSDLAHGHVLCAVGRKLHGDLVGRQSVELADLELLLGLHGRDGELRASGVRELIAGGQRRTEVGIAGLAASDIRWVSLIKPVLGLSVLNALVKGWPSRLLHTGNLLDNGPLVLPVTLVRATPVLDHQIGFLIALLVVHNVGGLDKILCRLRFLLEVILLVDVLYDLLVLALYVFDLLLQVLELEVERLDLLVAAQVPRVAHGLRYLGVCGGI